MAIPEADSAHPKPESDDKQMNVPAHHPPGPKPMLTARERECGKPQARSAAEVDFDTVYPVYVEAFSRLLISHRNEFGGDLDLVLILAVIGERYLSKQQCQFSPTFEHLGATPVNRIRSINTLSIAHFTGIPRETVRRKVGILIDRGWVKCDEAGYLSPTAQSAADLRPSTDAAMTFIKTIASITT